VKRLIKGILLGPLLLAAMIFLLALTEYAFRAHEADSEWFMLVLLITAAALLITNIHVFLLGIPFYLLLKKYGRVTSRNLVLGGLAIGMLFGIGFSRLFEHRQWSMIMAEITVFALCGAIVAFSIWWIGIREKPAAIKE
jgi:hypothetical protein